jgi:hypothetical protein
MTGIDVTADVGILDGIGIDNSFSGCTAVDVTAGVGATVGISVTADVGVINGFRLWKLSCFRVQGDFGSED